MSSATAAAPAGTATLYDLKGTLLEACSWALMLVLFAAGFANLAWMAVLAAVTAYEKIGRHGRRLTPVLGVALAGWGAVVLSHPGWLPTSLGGP